LIGRRSRKKFGNEGELAIRGRSNNRSVVWIEMTVEPSEATLTGMTTCVLPQRLMRTPVRTPAKNRQAARPRDQAQYTELGAQEADVA
jgi:hypothetical protein